MVDELDMVDALAQISFLVQGTLECRAAEHGISLIQTRLLGILRDRKPTMNELALSLGLDKSSISGLVDRAERRGLVRRVPSQLDRRSVRVRLTEPGRLLVQAVAAAFADDVAAMLEPLPVEDRTALVGYLSKVLEAHAATHGAQLGPTTAR
ncbi:MAG TPA: MarR family transcriptional regulator [Solirubrobacteraceae bacterium]|nr:MarR family transcriptional regulator [Solirubrobacteraceae bacterium]